MKKLILILIILLAAFLRLYRLDSYPAMNADEAAIGYNAYSLLQTGADEHGNPWPIHFQSFNDFKPGLYFYLVLPFVRILGLTELAVRLPGALLGVFTVFIVYLLVKELGRLGGLGKLGVKINVTALTASFFLAISPWHIHFSRGGWEVNVATFFITLGVWLFLKGIKNSVFLFFSILVFVFSLYTYHSARIVIPLLVLGFLFIFRKEIYRNLKVFIFAGLFGLLLLVPLSLDLTKGAVFSRAAGVGLFADPGIITRINEQRGEHERLINSTSVILHNKLVNYPLSFLENWGEHFSGEFLFLTGDEIQRNKVPETGQMYLLDMLFLLAGFVYLIKSKIQNPKTKKLIICWLVVAPTAAALTFQSPHALRSHNMVIPLVIISAYGLVYLSLWLHKCVRNKRFLDLLFVIFILAMAWNFTRYLHMYWVHMAKDYPFSSQYGVPELVSYIAEEEDKYDKIIVTSVYDQPYILFLYYLKYPPQDFQPNHQLTTRDKFGFSTVESFDKYEFREINFDTDQPNNPNSLIIGTDREIPDEANIVKEIYGTNGYLYFQVVAN